MEIPHVLKGGGGGGRSLNNEPASISNKFSISLP